MWVFIKYTFKGFSFSVFFVIKTITQFVEFFFGYTSKFKEFIVINFWIKIINGNFLIFQGLNHNLNFIFKIILKPTQHFAVVSM